MNKVGHLKGAAAAGTYLNQLLAAGNSGWYGFLSYPHGIALWATIFNLEISVAQMGAGNTL